MGEKNMFFTFGGFRECGMCVLCVYWEIVLNRQGGGWGNSDSGPLR